ncbi:MAG: proprotein convertase P-domain-containing protein, partial [Myxococcota bacterium]
MKRHVWWNWMPTQALLTVALVAVGVAGGGDALAAVPQATLIEGSLNSTLGGPVADGDYDVTFALYADAEGGDALWTEGPVKIAVAGGRLAHRMGSIEPLTAAVLANADYLQLQVGSEVAMSRRPLSSVVFALRVAVAETLDCSGCVPLTSLAADALDGLVKSSSLSKVATSGKYTDAIGAVDTSVFANSADLATVASTGAYADVEGQPDLSGYAKTADLSAYAKTAALSALAKKADLNKFAATGAYSDLSGTPTLPAVGAACGTNLVVAGLKQDGTLECVLGQSAALKADDLVVVSNGAMSNVFIDNLVSAKVPLAIPDNNPLGVGDTLVVPDLGLAQKLTVSVKLTNSDISGVTIQLFDPENNLYKLYDKGGTGTALDTTYPAPTKTISGDLTYWQAKNPKGNWFIQVIDTKFKDNTTDGQVVSWGVSIQTLSSKKVQVVGDLIIDGNLTMGSGGLMPSGAVIGFNGSSCPTGYALADGSGTLPNLVGRLPLGVGNLPYGGSIGLRAYGGTERWRMYGGDGSCTYGGRGYAFDGTVTGMGWQGETDVTVSRGTSWTGYYTHMPPYRGLLYCIKL